MIGYGRKAGAAVVLLGFSVLAGPACLVVQIREVRLQGRLQRQGIRVQGTVSRYKREWSGAGESAGRVTFAMVSFADAYGNVHECKPTRSGVRHRPIGLAVPVIYLPDSPSTTARIDRRSDRRQRIILGFVASAVFIVFPFVLLAFGGVR
ncbi:DUF3592 domain-containing protein [Actinoallomurus rhizosphaericola]|uniref:DUF3592 domain-containing protein n=1 Tax=Actinoallomurus rhizosphaericola TaxID=2952536 RepID=UPI0020903CB5|nr:DUF3592 domain-containing protein [Actinoallomurus rhizosphaericola]MCO5992012.1 DUF3592 domain-containing protein [Actinoallomurus rhizosphaericola]